MAENLSNQSVPETAARVAAVVNRLVNRKMCIRDRPQSAPKATASAQTAIGDGLVAEAQAFADELAAWRHDLHQMPELGNSLPQTSTYILSLIHI